MEYTWNRKKIEKLFKKAKTGDEIEIYSSLLSLININNFDSFDKSSILLIDPDYSLDFTERMKLYITGLNYIPDELYSDITDMFYWFQDFDAISREMEFKKLNLTNKELTEIVYEMIESINNKELLKAYKEIINPNNNLLYICNENDNVKTEAEKLGGITLKNPKSKKSFIAVFRNNTIEDIEILLHETMHYLYNYLLYKRNKIKDVKYYTELEGQFGSMYTSRYLSNIFKEEANKLRTEQFNSILSSAFMCLVNACLYQTSQNKSFRIDKAEELINKEMQYGKVFIKEEELDIYTTIKGFDTMTNIISYLISLELLNEETANECLNYIYNIKFDDGITPLEVFDKYGIHFHKDGYKDLIKEYKLTHK